MSIYKSSNSIGRCHFQLTKLEVCFLGLSPWLAKVRKNWLYQWTLPFSGRGGPDGVKAELPLYFLVEIGKERFLRWKSELRILTESGLIGFSMAEFGNKPIWYFWKQKPKSCQDEWQKSKMDFKTGEKLEITTLTPPCSFNSSTLAIYVKH